MGKIFKKPTPKLMITSSESAQGRAQNIIYEKRITLVPKQAGWMVMGSNGVLHSVQLFKDVVRNSACTCYSTTTCCHIMAATQSIDCVFLIRKKANTIALRERTRSKAKKQLRKKKTFQTPKNNYMSGHSLSCATHINPH